MGRLKLKFVSSLPDLFAEGETLKDLVWQDVGTLREGMEAARYRKQSEGQSLRGGVFQEARRVQGAQLRKPDRPPGGRPPEARSGGLHADELSL